MTISRKSTAEFGFTLVELMVAMAIGMVLVLAIATILNRHEAGRRTLTSSNDATMAANFTSFSLDQQLRDAGTDFLYTGNGAQDPLACILNVQRAGTQILPATTAFPAPFGSVPTTQRLAPLVVYPGAGAGGSDVISVASGASGLGGVLWTVTAGSATASSLRLTTNSLGIKAGDLALINDPVLGGCAIQQVAAGFVGGSTDVVNFGGIYAGPVVGSIATPAVGATGGATVAMIGNATASSPKFLLYGINARNEMVSYDLLNLNGAAAVNVIGEGVIDLRAVYGVDTTGDNILDGWESPSTAPYTPANLVNFPGAATPAQQNGIRSIVAVRIGAIVRGDLIEKSVVAPEILTLFDSVGLGIKRTLTGDERRYRIRAVEFTVPLRNQVIN